MAKGSVAWRARRALLENCNANRQLETGEATWSENQLLPLERHGFAEECYFTFSYSAIRDESGGIGGVHCAVTETTRQVLGERRLRTLRNLATRAGQSTAPDDACRLAAATLALNPDDLPFALIYVADRQSAAPQLAGVAIGAVDDPDSMAGDWATQAWPFADASRLGGPVRVEQLPGERWGRAGAADDAPHPTFALVIPFG